MDITSGIVDFTEVLLVLLKFNGPPVENSIVIFFFRLDISFHTFLLEEKLFFLSF